MRIRILAFLFLVLSTSVVRADESAVSATPPVTLGNTEQHVLHSAVTNRDYLLYVGYPDSYSAHPERRYPVVYLTDGYWNFAKVFSFGSSLWYDGTAPEYIVVGIGYAGENIDYHRERMFELTSSTPNDKSFADVRTGGSAQFLESIKTELIPYVETHTHADPSFRVIAGHSLGGLFSLYAMYGEPGLFQGVIAASPTVQWDHFLLFRSADELRQKALGEDGQGSCSIPSRLYLSVGSEEDPYDIACIRAFDVIVSNSNYTDFSNMFSIIEGERHAGAGLDAFQQGIRYVFAPLLKSDNP